MFFECFCFFSGYWFRAYPDSMFEKSHRSKIFGKLIEENFFRNKLFVPPTVLSRDVHLEKQILDWEMGKYTCIQDSIKYSNMTILMFWLVF